MGGGTVGYAFFKQNLTAFGKIKMKYYFNAKEEDQITEAVHMGKLILLPCLDSDEMAASVKSELDISRGVAYELGHSAVKISRQGFYPLPEGQVIKIRESVQAACNAKISIPPEMALPPSQHTKFLETNIQVTNETTFQAAFRLIKSGRKPLALNFANGVHPGGGFLYGAKAQEEVLCRSSALYETLLDDPMYEEHASRPTPDSTSWSIYSPDVPVFRTDGGAFLPEPWLLSFITCAAPVASSIGKEVAAPLLKARIHRVLSIAEVYNYSSLVLGAWGCGAFGNDPLQTAQDFRHALENEFSGSFSEIVFAITDWSPNRKFLGPFRDAFS